MSFLKWLNPHPASQDIYTHTKCFQSPKTFSSVLNSTEFWSWLEYKEGSVDAHNTKVLDIIGSEHCGKSTITAAFIDQLPVLFQAKGSFLCPVFLERDDTAFAWYKKDFCAALHEIFRLRPELLTKELITKYHTPTTEHLSAAGSHPLFKEVATQCSPLYILLDRFDPWSAERFYEKASHLSKGPEQPFSLRIIIFRGPDTDRYKTEWEGLSKDEKSQVFSFSINSDSVKEDMAPFVREAAKKIAINRIDDDGWTDLVADVKETLMKGTTNNFLLMRTSLDYIRQQPSVHDVCVALKSLSPDIKEMYMKTLTQISTYQDGRTYLTVEIMKALLSSFRPLKLRELAELVVIQPGTTAIDDARRYREQNFGSEVQSLCGPLVLVEQQDDHQVVRPSSVSRKEYLKALRLEGSGNKVQFLSDTLPASYSKDERDETRWKSLVYISKDSITRKCISYLSFSCFSGEESSLPVLGDKEGWLNRFPFFDYTSNCWLNHLFDLADYMKNPFLVEGSNWARKELWFDKDLLGMLVKFLALPNSWTYLEGLLLFSSAREARETLSFCRYLIADTEKWLDLWDKGTRPDHPNARILEDWALGTYDFLGDIESLPIEDALQVIRQSRQAQIEGTGLSLLDNRKALKIAGHQIGEAGPGAEKYC
jgi:hypothetical protein